MDIIDNREIGIVLFGSVPLASKILKYMIENHRENIIGVVCERSHIAFKNHYFDERSVYSIADDNNIDILDISDIKYRIDGFKRSIGISARFNRILPSEIINLFSTGVLNFHGGPLPSYRGVHSNIHAILNGDDTFGGSLHFLDEGIDTGDIIENVFFKIQDYYNSYDIFCMTQDIHWKIFLNNIESILKGKYTRTKQSVLISNGVIARTYRKIDIENMKELNFKMDDSTFVRRVRAFDFPGHEPCWISIGGRKIYLRTRDVMT